MNKLEKRNIRDILALTPMQAGMLFHSLKAPGRDFYANHLTLEISAKIDRESVKKAWNFVIKTNEMLRTVFRWEKLEKPSQAVLKNHTVNFRFKDLAAIEDEREKQAQWRKIKAEGEKCPFDLRDVAFRVLLCRVSEQRFYLVISNHHILYDGWSTGIILREFLGAYEAFRQGDQPPSPPARPQFKDFIRWQQTQDQEKQKKFWRQYLEGFEPQPPLPGKGIHRDQAEEKENSVRLVLAKETKDRLEYFAQQKRVTLAAVFYGAWAVLLQKYHCREDVVFGTIVSGRSVPLPGIENLVGLLINTLPLRAGTAPGESLLDFLRKINHHLAERKPYENTPLPEILNHWQQKPGAGSELFDSIIAIENWPLGSYLKEVKSQLSIISYRMEETPHYDLTLVISPFDDIEIQFIYNNDSLAKSSVVRLAEHFQRILEAIPSHLSLRVHEIEMLSPEEKHRLLVTFNETGGTPGYSPDRTIDRLFSAQVERTPDQVALIWKIPNSKFQIPNACGDVQVTYSELSRQASGLAGWLREKGVTADTLVAIMVERSIEMVIGILGILNAGCAYVPLDPNAPASRLVYILKECSAELLLIMRRLSGPAGKLDEWEGETYVLEECQPRAAGPEELSWQGRCQSTHLAYVIFTSGSTGKPKGVAITHANFSPLIHWGYKTLGIGSKDRAIQNLAYYFDWSVWEMFIILTSGASMYQVPEEVLLDPEICIPFMKEQKITILHATPSQYQHYAHSGRKLETLTYLFLGAEKLTVDLLRRSFASVSEECRVFNMYGPTEATIISAVLEIQRSDAEKFLRLTSVPIGRPTGNTTLLILDKYQQLCPVSLSGELHIGGDGVARGYLNQPELTNKKFLRGAGAVFSKRAPALYRTGDLARWLEDGNIEFLGRLDFQVKIRGFRIEMGEIESRLLRHEGIREAVVAVRTDEAGENFLCAYLVPVLAGALRVEEIRPYLEQGLPPYMIPAYFVILEQIPLSSNGKIDRKSLPQPGMVSKKPYVPPGKEIEEKLVRIWADLLGMNNRLIGIDDDFFELGGHSLKVAGLIGSIHKKLDIEVPFSQLFKSPTVRSLAVYISNQEKNWHSDMLPVEKREYYPLLWAQKSLFFIRQREPLAIVYNMSGLLVLEGELDVRKLESAFLQLITRHESLRASFHLVKDEPVQRVHDTVNFEIRYHDLTAEGTEGDERKRGSWEVRKIGREENKTQAFPKSQELRAKDYIKDFIRPFDLSQAPLLRVGLVKIEEEKHLLMVDMHHIIADGVSMDLLVKDFRSFYCGQQLPLLTLQYKDFSQWQQSEKARTSILRQGLYWQMQFREELPVLDLPADFARPPVQSFEGNSLGFEISGEAAHGLRCLSRGKGVTLYMLLLSVFNVWLSKLTNQEGIIVGTAAAGRRHTDLEPIIGMFVNTLALLNYPQSHMRFNDFLGEVKEKTLAAFENQDYPFEELVNTLKIERDVRRNPVFDVMFAFQPVHWQEIQIPGLILKPLDYKTNIAKFDLMLLVEELEQNLSFRMEYSGKLFKEETIHRFIRYFKVLAAEIVRAPGVNISKIEIISAAEREELLSGFNNTASVYPRDRCLDRLFAQEAQGHPGAAAVVYEGEYLTYGALDDQADRLAGVLQGRGVGPDTRVGIMLDASLEMIVAVLAVIKAGGAYLPLDPDYPEDRIKYMLADSGVKILLKDKELSSWFSSEPGALLNPPAGRPSHSDHSSFPETPNYCRNLAYIIYTSGSTGRPKGVMVEHINVVRLVKNTNYIQFNAGDRLLQTGALEFDASTFEIWGSLLNGLTLFLAAKEKRLNPGILKSIITRNRIAVMWMTAPLFNRMADSDEELFAGLRNLLVGGDVLSPAHIHVIRRRFPGLTIINGYGPTENTTFSTTFSIETEYRTNIPIGKPIANSTAYIVDKNENLQPVGVFGELWVGGDGVSRGYLNNPELTNKTFLRGAGAVFSKRAPAIYRTGDLARWLPEGNIEFLGRMDKQVKIRGFRIEPGEIENHLLKHNRVKEAVVMVRTDRSEEKHLCAYVVGEQDDLAPVLREFLSGVIPAYMVPSYVVMVESIPLTANGKVDWRSLPEPVAVSPGAGLPSPRDTLEKKLAEIWSEVLGLEARQDRLGIDDNFFEVGGHSLKTILLVSKIHKIFDVDIPLTDVFTHPSIRELSALIIKKRREIQRGDFISIEPVEKKEYYKLSSMQARLYVLQDMEAGIGYNIPSFWLVEGHGGSARFERIFRQLIRRHESLRTSFHLVKDEPVQRVHDRVNFELEYYDLTVEDKTHAFSKSQEPRAKSYIKRFIRPFDLSQAPLLRVGLAEIGEEKHLLMVDLHHIIADGTSARVLIEDFMKVCQRDSLPGQKIQYNDFVAWQRNQTERLGQAGAYWLKQFAGEIPVLTLPTDYARPMLQGFEGRTFSFEVDEEQCLALKSLAREQEVTLFMLLLGIYTGFLSRLSGQEDVVVGTPIAGRRHVDLEHILGMFVNTLALRNFPVDQKPFKDFLSQVRERSLEAFENQDFPFENLVEQVEVERDTSRNPLFDTMFILQNIDYPAIEIPGLKLTPYAYESLIAKFDLTLTAVEAGEKLSLRFEYSTHLFKEKTIARLRHYFMNVLAAVIADKRIKLGEIEIIPEEEKQRILIDFNDTAAPYPREKFLYRLFAEQVERSPGQVALVGRKEEGLKGRRVEGKKKEESCGQVLNACGGVQVTYKELKERIDRLADWLKEKGVHPYAIVGIMVERSIEMVMGILGVLKAGGAYLPIDPNYPEDRINYILSDSGANLLLKGNDLSAWLSAAPGALLNPTAGHLFHPHHSSFITHHSESLAYVIYTSGSTGKPKGVMVGNAAVVNLLYALQDCYPLTPRDTYLLKTSYMFDVSVTELFGWYMGGGRLAVLEPGSETDPGKIAETIEKQQVTHINFVPSMFNVFTAALHPGNVGKLRGLRYIFLAGEALLSGLVDGFSRLNSGVLLENLYGPTEAVVYASRYSLSAWRGAGPIPIGQGLPDVTLYILDRQGNLQPPGIPGELCIGGAGLAQGYLNQPELTAEKFCLRRPRTFLKKGSWTSKNFLLDYSPLTTHHSPIYRSGDLARWLEDGNIEYQGRIDSQVKIRGFRIELGEIEVRLLEHPRVQEAVVIARQGKETDKDLCAYVRIRENVPPPEPGVLKEFLADRLPGYMIPSFFVYLDKIPLTSSGKIDRKALPVPQLEVGDDAVAPRDKTERTLTGIWSEVLGVEENKLSIDANFFHLGGHSLKAAVMAAKIHKEMSVKIELPRIFKSPTIRELGRFIEQSAVQRYVQIELAEKREYYALTSAQKRLYIYQQLEPGSTAYNMPYIFRLTGRLDEGRFQETLARVVARHDVLRTVFLSPKGEMSQKIMAKAELNVVYGELGGASPEERTRGLIRPFDLTRAPLLRVEVSRVREECWLLFFDIHHIISEGSSMEILLADFLRLYQGRELNPLVVQYKDYAVWRNKYVKAERMRKQEQYWMSQLRGFVFSQLPVDRFDSFNRVKGSSLPLEIQSPLYHKMETFCFSQNVTKFIYLFTVFSMVLAREIDQWDLTLAIPTSIRDHPDLKDVIGIFLNVLLIRSVIDPGEPFLKLLERNKKRIVDALNNQDFPYELLKDNIIASSPFKKNELFSILFNYIPGDTAQPVTVPDFRMEPVALPEFSPKFDMTLYLYEKPEWIEVQVVYKSNLYREDTIGRLLGNFLAGIDRVLEGPGLAVSRLTAGSRENAVVMTAKDEEDEFEKYFDDGEF